MLAPTWLALGLPAFALAAALLVRLLAAAAGAPRPGLGLRHARADLAVVQYTPDGYSNPIRVVLRGLYGFRRTLEPIAGDRRAAALRAARPGSCPAFEHYLYRPLARAALCALRRGSAASSPAASAPTCSTSWSC